MLSKLLVAIYFVLLPFHFFQGRIKVQQSNHSFLSQEQMCEAILFDV